MCKLRSLLFLDIPAPRLRRSGGACYGAGQSLAIFEDADGRHEVVPALPQVQRKQRIGRLSRVEQADLGLFLQNIRIHEIDAPP